MSRGFTVTGVISISDMSTSGAVTAVASPVSGRFVFTSGSVDAKKDPDELGPAMVICLRIDR